VRALYSSYNGPLYQVRRTADNQTKEIGVLTTGGFADAAAQDSFLNGKAGTISKIYDQSPKGNHLVVTPPGGWMPQGAKESIATDAKIKVNGHTVYGVFTNPNTYAPNYPGGGYRNVKPNGVATGNAAEGIYMVCDGKHYVYGCCFDYGNAQTSETDNGNASMESIYWGSLDKWGHGSGSGPWVMNDCENGLQAGVDTVTGSKSWANNTPIIANYVTATLKSKATNFWEIRGGDANSGKIKTMYGGRQFAGWYPKRLEGSIILGTGGDNSNGGGGTFFEGALTTGCPSDTTEDSVEANIAAAGYGSAITSTRQDAHETFPASPKSPFGIHYNSSSATSVIGYALPDARCVSITIVDQRGREVASINQGVVSAGSHLAVWDTKRVPAGVYVCGILFDSREGWSGKIVIGK
jgi:hypothetical protein